MGERRQITILENVVESIAEIAFFIESKGMPDTAKKYVDEIFTYFEKLSAPNIKHRNCEYKRWELLAYSCINYKRKYVIAYLDLSDEIIICDFVPAKLLSEK
jgi:plasmid stabilization system protein ParE